jgi:hypothetical protein
MPYAIANNASRTSSLRASPGAVSPTAIDRTIIVSVWFPKIPACPITTGKNTARIVSELSVSVNRFNTNPVARTVARLINSHGSQWRTEPRTDSMLFASPRTPSIRNMSSVASASTTSTRSSMAIAPSSRPSVSTTGMERIS